MRKLGLILLALCVWLSIALGQSPAKPEQHPVLPSTEKPPAVAPIPDAQAVPDAKPADPTPAAKYEWTADEATELMEAKSQWLLAQQAAALMQRNYFSIGQRIHDAHKWPTDVVFNGKDWAKDTRPIPGPGPTGKPKPAALPPAPAPAKPAAPQK